MQANAPILAYDWAALGEHNMRERVRPDEWQSVDGPGARHLRREEPQHPPQRFARAGRGAPDAELRVLEGMGHRLKVPVLAPVQAEFLGDTGR